jgi:hypothetical protein
MINHEPKTQNIRLLGLIIVISIILFIAVVVPFFRGAIPKDAGHTGSLEPVLSLELIRYISQVATIAPNDGVRDGLKTALLIDSFVIVPFYVALFLLMCKLLAVAHKSWLKNNIFNIPIAKILALTAAVFSVLGGLGDLIENYFSYWILSLDAAERKQWLVDVIWWSSHIKFVLIFTAISILSLVFWRFNFLGNGESKLRNVFRLGILTILGFSLLTLGVIGDYAIVFDYNYISFAMMNSYLGIFIAGFLFFWLNRDFLKDF